MEGGEPILGIDLGTSKGCVAAVDQQGTLRLVSDPQGRSLVPSVVSFSADGNVLVGEEAVAQRPADPQNTIGFDSWPNSPTVLTRAGEVGPVDVGAILLDHLRRIADNALSCDSKRVVLTVPHAYDNAQRQLVVGSAQRVGLAIENLLTCPVAASYAYGLNDQPLRFVVCDFGAAKFECSILGVRGGQPEVLGSCCDLNLGGGHINRRLVDWMVSDFAGQHGFDLRHDPVAMIRLNQAAEFAKRQLWSYGGYGAQFAVPEVCRDGNGKLLDLSMLLTLDIFNQYTADLIERALSICTEALRRAQTQPAEAAQVVLIGGSCRIPMVQQRLRQHFGTQPRMDVDPETGIALGAALAATKTAINKRVTASYGTVEPPPDASSAAPVIRSRTTRIGRVVTKKRFTAITDAQAPDMDAGFATPHTPQGPTLIEVIATRLALSTVGGFCDEIIGANEAVPSSKTRVFSTGRDNQREVHVRVCQGDSRRYNENRPLGALVLDELPPRPRGTVKIAVTFSIDDDGVLEASARDEQTGQEQSVRIQLTL